MLHSLASSFKLSIIWLLSAVLLTIVFGTIYVAVQQAYRHGADDPQIEITEEVAAAIQAGADIQSMLPTTNTDIGTGLSPFIVLYGDDGKPLGGSGVLDGQLPTLPAGVLAFAKDHGSDRLTWQPKPNVRIAAVVKRLSGKPSGYVLAGRSLREVEIRESQLTITVGVAWLASLIISLLMLLVAHGDIRRPGNDAVKE